MTVKIIPKSSIRKAKKACKSNYVFNKTEPNVKKADAKLTASAFDFFSAFKI